MTSRITPSVRNVVWNALLLASIVGPLAWLVAPKIHVTVPAVAAVAVPQLPATTPVNDAILSTAAARSAPTPQGHPGEYALILWAIGAGVVMVRFSRQVALARRLVKRAVPSARDDLASVVASARGTLGVRTAVWVLESQEIDVPVAAGIFTPVILLPADSIAWPRQTLRLVLLHELAHVRRGDVRARGVAMVACAIHWFNPFVWLLSELSRRDAELAADDLVVSAGVKPSSYAGALLSFAEDILGRATPEPAMLFVRRGFLARRVHSILRGRASRELSASTRLAVLGGSCVVACLAACVELVPAAQHRAIPAVSTRAVAISDQQQSTVAQRTVKAKKQAKTRAIEPKSSASAADSTWVDAAAEGLIVALADSSPQVRGEAAHALGNLQVTRARSQLASLLQDPDKYVRYEADRALTLIAASAR